LGTAGVANTTNNFSADSAFTNPAGMTGLVRDEFLSGFQAVIPRIEFDPSIAEKGGDDGGNAGLLAAIPSLFAVKTLGERARLGFSVTAPLGGGTNYGDGFAGRFGAIKVKLSGLALSPSLAYKISDRVSVGAGLSLLYTSLEQSIAINQGPLPDGKLKLDNADDWSLQPFVGLTFQATDRAFIGLLYRGEADVNLRGDLNFRNLAFPTPPANEFKLNWDNPQLVELGLRYQLNDEWRLFAIADWEDWSEFSENRLALQEGVLNPAVTLDRNLKDTWKFGFAAGRLANERLFSFGFSYDSSPVDDKDRTIDLPLDEQLRLSASYSTVGTDPLSYSIGATLFYGGEGDIDQTAQGVRFKGDFKNNLVLFLGGTLRYVF
jgi:long-chain fatty acid transport protein